jgi:hypothetical protein
VFVILGDVLELFVADGAVKRPKDLRYLSLESDATGNTSLWAVQMMSYKLCTCTKRTKHSPPWLYVVPLFRSAGAQNPTHVAVRP